MCLRFLESFQNKVYTKLCCDLLREIKNEYPPLPSVKCIKHGVYPTLACTSYSTPACTYHVQFAHALDFELEQHLSFILNMCMHTIHVLIKHVDALQTQLVHEHHT